MPDDDDTSLDPSDEVDPEAAAVARDLLTAFGDAWDQRQLPRLDGDRGEIDLGDDPSAAIARLAETPRVSGPVKLELLGQLVRAGKPNSELVPLARSLVRADAPPQLQDKTVSDLLDLLRNSKPGEDPVGRTPNQTLAEPGDFIASVIAQLVDDVHDLVLAFDSTGCSAEVVEVGSRSTPALSIATTAWTTRSLLELAPVINPFDWPKCPLQHVFFRSMTDAGPKVGLDAPDQGWRQTLREVVDFSFALGWATFTTDLDFVFFQDPGRIGCTYDRHTPGGDGQITIDQGYLLAEDFGAWRRVRTLKQVHFAMGNLPSAFVCPFWGPATSAIAWACLPSKEQP